MEQTRRKLYQILDEAFYLTSDSGKNNIKCHYEGSFIDNEIGLDFIFLGIEVIDKSSKLMDSVSRYSK